MIPETVLRRHPPAWQAELAAAITDPAELLAAVGLEAGRWLAAARAAARCFPLKVPRGFVARMRRGDPRDPLLRQVLPLAEEREPAAGYSADPLAERARLRPGGLLQKYSGRVLLTATGACAVHCRYCFRRHFPYAEANASADGFRRALAQIAADTTIREVILSGGDPLTLSDRRLHAFTQALAGIAHVERLRLHTRLPIVLPSRVDDGLLAWLASVRQRLVIVVHANHANEIDAAVRGALGALRAAGAVLLNQTVLLRGVNDSVEALADLSEALFAAGVLPYYLHQLDRVQGAAHFEVKEARARELCARLRERLPGYLVPRLVRDEPGAAAKRPLI